MVFLHLPSEGVNWGGCFRVSCTFSGGVEGPLGNGVLPQTYFLGVL